MPQGKRDKTHLFLGATGKTEPFTSTATARTKQVVLPTIDRNRHGLKLRGDLSTIKNHLREQRVIITEDDLSSTAGLQLEFESLPDIELAFGKLASNPVKVQDHIEVVNVTERGNKTYATIFVPDGQLDVFERKITSYLDEKKDKNGRPQDNKKLINTIAAIRSIALEGLWTDSREALPVDETKPIWWEVWLPTRSNRDAVLADFMKYGKIAELEIANSLVKFPERTVLLARGNKMQLSSSPVLLNTIAELRLAKETANFFDALPGEEQREWVDDLLGRTSFEDPSSVRVCLLDTGVTSNHPLLAPLIDDTACFTVEPNWDTGDANGHGTEMAGLAGWGDLSDVMPSSELHSLGYKLESVKLLRHGGDNTGKHFGDITGQGVALADIQNPDYKRVYSMSLSATDNRDRGRPSAWSASMDSLAVDAVNNSASPRLFVICAGNVGVNLNEMLSYPDYNLIEDCHDPAQAWNAITVGAYTEKTSLRDEDARAYQTLSPPGGLSPFSTTSVVWGTNTPIKPELVLEGGNAASDGHSASHMPSLSLLTTSFDIQQRLLTTTRATSAATALLAKMSAEVMVVYPDLWPETIRALLVHSADWTKAQRIQFDGHGTERQKIARVIKCCGYGVPSLPRAIRSANNSLTMVIEDSIKPFFKDASDIKTNEMHLHELPWPKDILSSLGELNVTMTVTLSYFIEPNPAARGVKGPYSYQSCGLRFDIKRSLESIESFRAGVNKQARSSEVTGKNRPEDKNWTIGSDLRHKGSIHKDIWHGTAAELADRGYIAIYPTMGWWRTRKKLERYDRSVRYALVVSIETPETDVDIYTEVANQIATEVAIKI